MSAVGYGKKRVNKNTKPFTKKFRLSVKYTITLKINA